MHENTQLQSPSHYLTGLVLAAAGAILFSGKAIVAKLLYREGIDAVSLIALRMLLAAPFFIAIAFWTWRQQPVLSRADLFRITLLGLMGYYLSSFLDFLAKKNKCSPIPWDKKSYLLTQRLSQLYRPCWPHLKTIVLK